MSQSLRGSTVTNYFKFSLAGTSTILLYSFESPWASLCPCANTCCVRGVASARPRRASKRLDCRLWKRDLFHQHNRKGKIVMIETSRYKGLVFGFVFGTWNWYDFWRRSWGLPCRQRVGSPVGMQKGSPRIWPSLSNQDDWKEKAGTIAGTAHTQEYLLLHLAMFPIGLHTWCHVLGMAAAHQLQAQIIHRAKKVFESCPITPAHRKPPWPGYKQGIRLFTKVLVVAHPLAGVCLPPDTLPTESLQPAGYGWLANIRGHSAGSYAGMVWETILAEFPHIAGSTVLAAIALPQSLLTRSMLSYTRQIRLIHHGDDRLCVDSVQSKHEDAPAAKIHCHIHHWVASVSWLCSAQLCALDTVNPSRRTMRPHQPGKNPRRTSVWDLCASPTATYLMVQLWTHRFGNSVRRPKDHHPKIGRPDSLAKHTGPDRTRRCTVSRNTGHSAHRIKSSDALIQSGEQNQMTEIWLRADSCFWTSQASLDGFCMASSAAAKPRARPRKSLQSKTLMH